MLKNFHKASQAASSVTYVVLLKCDYLYFAIFVIGGIEIAAM